MIYPQAKNASAGGSAGKRAGKNSSFAEKRGVACRKNGKGGKPQQVVQWKQKNVEEGIVVVDEQQLSKLIKREPIEKHYRLDPEPFATGLFASVRRCVSLDTGEVFAAKFSSRARYGEDCSAEIHHEIALLSLCAPSPRIVKLHDVFETPTEIIILMQFAPGGDLQTVIDDNLVPFETDVVNFVRQLVEGLAYLHERKIAHLDIKPQNLVMMGDFPNCDVKLCDFEISRVILEGTEIREILGTPDYVAPEILHYEPITLAADLWSLGVTTYVLLTGFSPFGGETDQETFCNISRAQLDFPEELFEDVSQDAKDFIRQLLVREPGARPTAKNLLKHRWLSRQSAPRCRTAGPNTGGEKNLRKYLSKSREALFERVVQQQQRNNDLRKTTLLSQYNKTRMCESHTSLVSRVRDERPLVGLSPSFSRSREKLYGLRSLSRSHEGLDDLLRLSSGGREGGKRAYARASTADLGTLPVHAPPPPATPDVGEKPREKIFRKINSDSCITVPSLVSPTLLKNTLEQCAKLVTATPTAEQDNTHIADNEHNSKLTGPTTALDANSTKEQNSNTQNKDRSISTGTPTANSAANQDKTQNSFENNEDKSKLTSTLTILNANSAANKDKTQNGIANNEDKSKLTSTPTTLYANSTKQQDKIQNGIAQNKDKSLSTPTPLDANSAANKEKTQNEIANNEDKSKLTDTMSTLEAKFHKEQDKIQNGIAQNKDKSISTPVHSAANKDKTENRIANNEDKSTLSGTMTTLEAKFHKEQDKTQNGITGEKEKPMSTGTLIAFDVDTSTKHETQNGDTNNEEKRSNGPSSKHDATLANLIELARMVNDSLTSKASRITNVPTDEAKEVSGQEKMDDNRGEVRGTGVETAAINGEAGGAKSSDVADTPEDEPSFTVAQLISAYNRHQEVVTKTSLEVTMTTKMAPESVVPSEPSTKFPTGPTALRLFIPDIDIETTVKKKKNRTKSYRTLARSGTIASDCTGEDRTAPVASPATDLDQANVSDIPAAERRVFPATSEAAPDFLRSVSLSSETSGGLTPSETLSSLSWEELAPSTPATPTVANPWGRLCNGSYTRAMEKFGGRNEQPNTETNKTVLVNNNNNARKCSLSMLFPQVKPEDEKMRRKSTSVIAKLS